MGYSVYASVFYGVDVTSWVESGDIFSSEAATKGNTPDFGFNNVSLEYSYAEYIGYKFYLCAEGWSGGTEDINARDFGETIEGCGTPSEKELSKMNKNIDDALEKIAKHYDTEVPFSLSGEIIVKAYYG